MKNLKPMLAVMLLILSSQQLIADELDQVLGPVGFNSGQLILLADPNSEWGVHSFTIYCNDIELPQEKRERFYQIVNTEESTITIRSEAPYRSKNTAVSRTVQLTPGTRKVLSLRSSGLAEWSLRERDPEWAKKRISRYTPAGVYSAQDGPEGKRIYAQIDTPPQEKQEVKRLEKKKEPLKNRHGVAIIVGNKNYRENGAEIPDVDFAHNDAEAMYRYVTQMLGFRKGNVIMLKDATQAQLTSVFGSADNPRGQLYNWVREDKSDVFVYYSGHGAPGLSNGKGYLVPTDANPMTIELNGYPLERLYKNLSKVPGKSLTVVLDACFSGGSQEGSVIQEASSISLKLVEPKQTVNKAAILTASALNQVASWDKKARLGLFTSYFLKGVYGKADGPDFGNQDGTVTLDELKNFLEDEVNYFARREYFRQQDPQISGIGSLEMGTYQ